MMITLKLWGHFTQFLPDGAEGYAAEVEVPDNATAREIAELFGVPFDECRLMLLNGIPHPSPPVWGDIRLKEGDAIAILPNIH